MRENAENEKKQELYLISTNSREQRISFGNFLEPESEESEEFEFEER